MKHRAAGLLMVLMMLAGACGRGPERELALRPVDVDDFSAPRALAPASPAAASKPLEASEPSTQSASPIAPAPPDAAVASGRPTERSSPPLQAGETIVIDRMVGQVSGRPIFAHALLEPIADQLNQESRRLDQESFIRAAASIVARQLNEVILNELFLAEAEASLTTQQQQGLFHFLRDFQERMQAEARGSRSLLEQKTQEEGMTPEEFKELERNRLLIGNLINQKIEPRVIVSWRDIEREYERRRHEFNPASTVTLARLSLSKGEHAELIEAVNSRLAAGESFETVTASLDAELVSVMDPLPMASRDVSDIEIAEIYKPHLKGLQAGETTGAIERENRTVWLHVVKVEQPPPRSLYDVQRQLESELYLRRRAEERAEYIKSLFEKGIYSELDEMSRRVLAVALVRYGR